MQNSTVTDHFLTFDENKSTIFCLDEWILTNLPAIDHIISSFSMPKSKNLILTGEKLKKMDSAGALSLYKLLTALHEKGFQVTLQNFTPAYKTILDLIATQYKFPELPQMQKPFTGLAWLGKYVVDLDIRIYNFLSFVGEMVIVALKLPFRLHRIHWRAFFSAIETTGYRAIPIIVLLTFLIGVVLAYQMGLQLKNYGAGIFIVDLIGISIFREFAPLITAIIIAGRTGSAFTAQIGTMKINEELDALRIMGILPIELLVVPRTIALMITAPLLTVLADIFGVFGGMFMSKHLLGIGYYDFFHRFQTAVSVKSFVLGMVKAPVFGILIAIIGCYQGFKVTNSADSVGQQTTRSVVQAIFFIIIADAAFSILYSALGI